MRVGMPTILITLMPKTAARQMMCTQEIPREDRIFADSGMRIWKKEGRERGREEGRKE